MKILKFKGRMSLKNKLLIFIAIILIIAISGVTISYIVNEKVRSWINVNVLKKEITEDDVATIEIDADKQKYILAYDKYIGILSNSKLEIYNSYGAKSTEVDVAISNPIICTNGNYLAIAEDGGQKAYLIADEKIIWENSVEGNITKINVSKSGNVSIITDREEDVLTVPNMALKFTLKDNTQKYEQKGIWVQRSGKPQRINIKTGLSDDMYTQIITDEVKEGDLVYTGTMQNNKKSSSKGRNGMPPRL